MPSLDQKNIEDIFNLTPLQGGLLFHYLKENSGSSQNFEQICLDIDGTINFDFFSQAWNVIVAHNEMLRTIFRWKKLDTPVQITLRSYHPEISFADLSTCSDEDRESALLRIKQEDKTRLFDLEDVPFRVKAIKFSDRKFNMMISNHSIIYDGWSNGVLLKEFFQCYLGLLHARPVQLDKKNAFKEFVKALKTAEPENSRMFWSDYLAAREEINPLTAYDNAVPRSGSAYLKLAFPEAMTAEINSFCKTKKITKAIFFYAVWGILLQKVDAAKDVIFGTTVSGRSVKVSGIENMVGLLINTLPMRVINKGQTIDDLLADLFRHVTEREAFESTSLVKIKEYGDYQPNENLFDTVVLIENYPLDIALFKNDPLCSITGFSFDQTNNFGIALSILNFENSLEIFFGYDCGRYSETLIRQYSNYFLRIAEQIVHRPEGRIFEIELLSPEEKQEIVQDFNRTDAFCPEDQTIQQLFARQVQRNPDKIAFVCNDEHMSYRMLDHFSDQLASRLRTCLGCKQAIIPVIMERSIQMPATLLGIIKAGHIYVPFEPSLPRARLTKLLHSLDASCVISSPDTISFCREVIGHTAAPVKIICITGRKNGFTVPQDIDIFQPDHTGRLREVQPETANTQSDDFAYIIYTSGSTGLPKGVIVRHQPVVNVIEWLNRSFNVTPDDRLLFVTSPGFDLSVYDIFGSLAAGMTVFIASREELADPKLLLKTLNKEQITVWDSAPAAFQQMVQTGIILETDMQNNKLRLVLLSGDWIGLNLPTMSKKLFGQAKIISLGGATEAVIWSNYFAVEEIRESWRSIPYGRPIQNARYYILDDTLNIVPKGSIGELYIGGKCLASGYVNDVVLTDQKFMDNPFASGEKMYRTGDMARWFDDGNIELIGRRDHQVKIRGFRIELGEIESRLLKHPQISNVAILSAKSAAGENYIGAFYETSKDPGAPALKDFLRQELPEYMIPAYMQRTSEIPLTANGKVDRAALLNQISRSLSSGAAQEPLDGVEKALAELWADILHCDIGLIYRATEFFDIGANSLSATILQARIEKKFNVHLPLKQLFSHASLQTMAGSMTTASEKLVSIKPAKASTYYPITSGQKRLYSLQSLNKKSTNYNIAGCIKITGKLDISLLEEVMGKIVAAQDVLRTSFSVKDGVVVQMIHPDIAFKLNRFRLSNGPGPVDFQRYLNVFDLSKPPLYRLSLIEAAPDVNYLLLDIHHIISDGLSVYKFIDDFVRGFSGQAVLRPLLQYKDYAVWTHEPEFGAEIVRQERYWRNEFRQMPQRLQLPIDFERPPSLNHDGDCLTFSVSKDQLNDFQTIMKETESTMFMVILSCFNVLLSKICGQTEVIIGIPAANRPHADLMDLMGFFVNTLALKNYVDGELTFLEFTRRVRVSTLNAFEHQDYPFEYLVSGTEPRRDPRHNPVFDVALDFDNLNLPRIQLPGLSIEPVSDLLKRAEFDLVLRVLPEAHMLSFKLEYCTRLFDLKTVEWIRDSLLNLFAAISTDHQIKLGDINIFRQTSYRIANPVQFEF